MRRRLLVAIGVILAWGLFTYFYPPMPHLAPLPRWEGDSGATVILAPHPDDETLPTAGLIQALEAHGVQPTVVLVTGGDAFKVSAEAYFARGKLDGQEMQAFGRQRLDESRSALKVLGLPPERLIFLGFPDQGLNHLWLDNWRSTAPYTSASTNVNRVPYSEAYQPGAPYAGDELERELVTLFRRLKPALIVYPHPNETHVDHWGLSNFTMAALEELRRTDANWRPPQEWHYLVHRGDWPAPKGYLPGAGLLPPEKLATGMTLWRQEPLTASQVNLKYQAVTAYRTQTAILRRYMESFVRKNEIFGSIDRAVLSPVGSAGHPFPSSDSPPWRNLGWVEVTTDPRGDTMARELERGADLLSVWAASDGRQLYVAAKMASKPIRPMSAWFTLRAFGPATGWGDLAQIVVQADGSNHVAKWAAPGIPNGLESEAEGAWLRTVLPLAALGNPETVMINVETRTASMTVDRSAWRPVSLDGR